MKTNNIIALVPLNTWHRNLELHQHQKGSTTLLSPLHFTKQVAGTRKRATLLKWLAVQKWILKSHSSKLLFYKIHIHLQVLSCRPACLLGFSSLGLHHTGYVFSRAGGWSRPRGSLPMSVFHTFRSHSWLFSSGVSPAWSFGLFNDLFGLTALPRDYGSICFEFCKKHKGQKWDVEVSGVYVPREKPDV